MTTLEEQLVHLMSDASSDLVLPPGAAARAWKRGRRRHHQKQAAGAGLTIAVLGVVVAAVATLYPAAQASTLYPIEAIRSE